jgi:hypothetical protein
MIRLTLAALLLSGSTPTPATSLSEAQDAYDNNKVADAERMFAAIAADSSASADDRSAADIALARIAWMIDGNADAALQRLSVSAGQPCDIGIMKLRVLKEAKRDRQAIDSEADLLNACPEAAKRDEMRVHAIAARLDLADAERAQRNELLAEAAADARLLTPDAGVEGARARLEIALMTDNAPAALGAWKDYFWLDDSDAPQALTHFDATRRFTRGLGRNATVTERLNLAELLMRAGFGEESRRYAEAHGLPGSMAKSPIWRRLTAYWTERDKLEAETLRVNRELAHGHKDDNALEAAAKSATASLMKAAGASGDPEAALLKYYGLVGSVGLTNGYPSIHLGHVTEDRDEQVSQYGHSAKIHFVAIDNMISNGFTSWLWDGSAMVGGWQANGTIIQVRPAYVKGPLNAYQLTRDGPERRKLIARQSKRAAEDIAALKQRPVATLEGLNDRLHLQSTDQVEATARSKAVGGQDVRRLFLAEYWRATLNHSIMVHEGRHAIDAMLGMNGKVDQSVLEYDAKLSELSLSNYPRMALENIDRTLEGSGPHDVAGNRIFDGYRRWMEAHAGEIMGYDPAVPALEQLDKLTDGQIREIARSLDPLAKEAAPTASAGNPSGTSTR